MSDQVLLETHGVEVRLEPSEGVVVVSYEGHDLAAIFIHDLRGQKLPGAPSLGIREFLIASWVRGEFRHLYLANVEDVDG